MTASVNIPMRPLPKPLCFVRFLRVTPCTQRAALASGVLELAFGGGEPAVGV